jgi:hypothetical protein
MLLQDGEGELPDSAEEMMGIAYVKRLQTVTTALELLGLEVRLFRCCICTAVACMYHPECTSFDRQPTSARAALLPVFSGLYFWTQTSQDKLLYAVPVLCCLCNATEHRCIHFSSRWQSHHLAG